jgi:ELWxxDGT repeat protein
MGHRSASSSRVEATVEALDRRLLLAAAPVLVKDINTATDRSLPTELTEVDGVMYFLASDGGNAQDTLWRSDGTPAGTSLLKNFSPEPGTQGFVGGLTGYNGRLFFGASEPDGTNFELWSSDGTPAGTARFMDLTDGPSGSFPSQLTTSNGALFFVANGCELWKTDGTVDGTVRVANPFPGAGSDGASLQALTDVSGTLFVTLHPPAMFGACQALRPGSWCGR